MAKAETIFTHAQALSPDERETYLADACAGDAALRAEVDALLNADAAAGSFLAHEDATIRQAAAATIRSAASEQVGDVIDRFKLLQPIGEGGFGVVWMAEQKEPVRRRVALKIIKLGMDTKQVIARFEAERQALAMMDHPNIAKVLDAGATETGRPFFAMEYIRGIPILEYCDQEKLDTDARLGLFKQVCHAIQHAHQKGIIHRDIKPSNVLITMHDGRPVAKVIDFGIAKATNTELTTKTLFTEHRQMIGTPAYMSPEQAEMSGLDIDTRSDVYSLGVLLYELLTGTTPFDSESLMEAGFAEMMRIIREEEPHKPSTRLSALGDTAAETARQRRVDLKRLGTILRGDLDWIVMRCLEKDRTRRYGTAQGLAEDIDRHMRDEPVEASPPSAGYRMRKFVRRNKGGVIGGTLVIASILIGIAGTLWGLMWALNERRLVVAQSQSAVAAMHEATDIVVSTFVELAEEYDDDEPRTLPIGDPAEYAGLEVDALGLASRNLAIFLSDSLRDEAASRKTAEQVAEFQDEQLGGIDVEMMGIRMRRSMLDAVDETQRAALRTQLDNVNFTEIARRALEESVFELAIEAIDTEFEEHPQTQARLLLTLANTLHLLGMNDLAFGPAERSAEIRRELLGEDAEETLQAEIAVGGIYLQAGRDADAIHVLEPALERAREALGDEAGVTRAGITALGNAYINEHRVDDARALHEEAIELNTLIDGPEHNSTLDARHNLASLYWNESRFDEAARLNEEVLAIRERVLPAGDEDVLASLNNLALAYRDLGRFEDAESLFQRLLESSARSYGDSHPRTLLASTNLAGLFRLQGRLDEAEEMGAEAIERKRRVLGNTHPDLARSLGNHAALMSTLGRHDEALALVTEGSEVANRAYGPEHPLTLMMRGAVGGTMLQASRFADGEAYLMELLADMTRVLGEEHPERLRIVTNVALAKFRLRQIPESERLYTEAIDLMKRVMGEDHPQTVQTQGQLAAIYMARGALEDARELLEYVYEWQVDRLGIDHPQTTTQASNLSMLLIASGDTDEGLDMLRSALEASREKFGDDHEKTYTCMTNLGAAYRHLGRLDEALEMVEVSLAGKRRLLGIDHEFTQNALTVLTMTYVALKRRDDAVAIHRDIVDERIRLAEADDASLDTLNTTAWALLTPMYRELRNAELALEFATRAVAQAETSGHEKLWQYLDTLGKAKHDVGDIAGAVETQKRAVDLMPGGANPQVPARLEQFKRKLGNS